MTRRNTHKTNEAVSDKQRQTSSATQGPLRAVGPGAGLGRRAEGGVAGRPRPRRRHAIPHDLPQFTEQDASIYSIAKACDTCQHTSILLDPMLLSRRRRPRILSIYLNVHITQHKHVIMYINVYILMYSYYCF